MGKDTVVALGPSSPPNPDLVISTEAAHGLIVSRAAEKPASLPNPTPELFFKLPQKSTPTPLTLEK